MIKFYRTDDGIIHEIDDIKTAVGLSLISLHTKKAVQ